MMNTEANAALLKRAKLNLRICHDRLDDEIQRTITAAGLAMRRAGVSEKLLEKPDDLTGDAILAYVMYKLVEDGNDRYFESWQYQVDCLRRHREESAHDEQCIDPAKN